MLLVTGGAGFIGSNLIAALNEAGRSDIAVNDTLGSDGKWCNLGSRQLADFVPPADLMRWLDGRKLDALLHLGANSNTTATDGDAVIESNFRLSLRLLDWCTATRTPFIYASSAATYGDGSHGFSDDCSTAALKRLKPMNLYGWSKHLFDLAVTERAARSFRDLIAAMFAALGREPAIEYIEMPASIRDSYQYFTEAETANLRRAGYTAAFTPLEDAVGRYVSHYLDRADRYR